MSQITRKMIVDCTLAMAEKKPLTKINVRDIVEQCGITRNTFYYHFHDIYDVIEGYITDKVSLVDLNNPESFFDLIDFAVEHKVVWQNVYKSMGHEIFSKFCISKLKEILTQYINHQPNSNLLTNEDKEIVCAFYEEAFLGMLVRWINETNNRQTALDVKLSIDRARLLFAGQLDLVIANARKKSE